MKSFVVCGNNNKNNKKYQNFVYKIELYWYWYCRSSHLCSEPGHYCPCPSVPSHQLTSTINITSYHRLLSTLYLKALIKCFTNRQSHRHKKQQFKAQAVDIQYVFCIHNSKKRRKLELGYSENVLMVWTDLLNNFLQRMFCKKW